MAGPGQPGRPKGLPKTGGRQKGSGNTLHKELKEMILGALGDVGGQAYLVEQARENPTAFLGLVSKLLPRDVKVESHTYNHRELSDDELIAILSRAGAISQAPSSREAGVVH